MKWDIPQITLLPISNFWVFPTPDIQIHAKSPFDSLKSESVSLSVVSHSATLWSVARQAPLSIGFSSQENWSGLACPPPGDLPDPGTKPTSPVSPALQGDSLPAGPSVKPFDHLSLLKSILRKRAGESFTWYYRL